MEPKKSIRRIIQVGASSGIVLPKDFLLSCGLKRGDNVELIYNGMVKIKPIHPEELRAELLEAKNDAP